MTKSAIVIGSGFSGLTVASELASQGLRVKLLEKNEMTGGRARKFEAEGFTFDMGPSWYWMPDIFASFFERFGKDINDYLDLVQLDPGFQLIFDRDEPLAVPANLEEIHKLFEEIEAGASGQLKKFLDASQRKYEVAMDEFIYLPSNHFMEFAKLSILKEATQLDLLKPFDKYVAKYFSDPRLRTLMEFPVLFLGAKPSKIPAMYSMMNYSALTQGTWYPMGGMHCIIEAFSEVAQELGVEIICDHEVDDVKLIGNKMTAVSVNGQEFTADYFVAASDYHHFETLLPETHRNYRESYWDKRTMSPSCLIFYVGVNKRLPKLMHHNLFFDTDFGQHAVAIYDEPAWPEDPQFYVCAPSITDKSVAPEGCENLFFLMPIAPGIEDNDEIRSKYYGQLMRRLETYTGEKIRDHVIYHKSYCIKDFQEDYHAYKGNAYGLANTLNQTAILKPKMKNRKIKNLWYTGQLTVPGPGMPPAIISGFIAAKEVLRKVPTTV